MFEREILLWPGVGLAVLGVLVLLTRGDQKAHFWGYDLLGAVGVAGGGLLLYDSQREDVPSRIDVDGLFEGIFDGWPQALLVSVIAAAVLLLAVILIRRSIPSWQRALALAVGVISVVAASHIWTAGL